MHSDNPMTPHTQILENSPFGQVLGVVLPMLIALGFVCVLVIRVWEVDLPRPLVRLIFRMFGLVAGSYVLWTAHFFLEIPFLHSPGLEFSVILIFGSVVILSLYFKETTRGPKEEFNPESDKRCPGCGDVIPKIAAKCPRCGKEQD